jgi:hypothetical protein
MEGFNSRVKGLMKHRNSKYLLEYSLLKTLTCFVKHTSSITDFPQATK